MIWSSSSPTHTIARHLVALTKRGESAYAAASRLQTPWANALAKGLDGEELAAASRIVKALSERLEKIDLVDLRHDTVTRQCASASLRKRLSAATRTRQVRIAIGPATLARQRNLGLDSHLMPD